MTNRIQAALFEQIAKLGKTLSSSQPLRIPTLLCHCESTVYTLPRAVGLPIATRLVELQMVRSSLADQREWAFAGRPVRKSPNYKSLFTPA
jgi:hypothetical protein